MKHLLSALGIWRTPPLTDFLSPSPNGELVMGREAVRMGLQLYLLIPLVLISWSQYWHIASLIVAFWVHLELCYPDSQI